MTNNDDLIKQKQKLQDEVVDIDLKLAALDGDEAAGAKIAMAAATAKMTQAEADFAKDMADIEAGVKAIFDEESKKLEEAQMEDAKKTIENS